MEWIKPMVRGLRKVFLVHGEPRQSESLAQLLHDAVRPGGGLPGAGAEFRPGIR